MFRLFLLLSLFYSLSVFAAAQDSLFQRHQFIVSETDAMSGQFCNGPSGPTINNVVTTGTDFFPKVTTTKYLPNYALHIHLKYSLGLSKLVRIETGLGYLFEGYTLRSNYTVSTEVVLVNGSYRGYEFIRSFTIPLHVKFIKAVGKGAFTCTLGPSFALPVNSFIKENHVVQNNIPQPDVTIHDRYTPAGTVYSSSLGFDLKMGYQKYFNHHIALDMGPIVNFSNLLLLDKNLQNAYRTSGYRPYQYYIGLDVAVNFGLKK